MASRKNTALWIAITAMAALSLPKVVNAQVEGIHKIKHIIIIMQENRSFDSYFGTFPGADGIPMKDGVPTVAVLDPITGNMVMPYHDPRDLNVGGPHNAVHSIADIDGGKMDGFIKESSQGKEGLTRQGMDYYPPKVIIDAKLYLDVMGYHDQREIMEQFLIEPHILHQGHDLYVMLLRKFNNTRIDRSPHRSLRVHIIGLRRQNGNLIYMLLKTFECGFIVDVVKQMLHVLWRLTMSLIGKPCHESDCNSDV